MESLLLGSELNFEMNAEMDSSYIIIVNSDNESDIKVYDFDTNMSSQQKINILDECKKLFKSDCSQKILDSPPKIKNEPDNEEDEFLLNVKLECENEDEEYINADDEWEAKDDNLDEDLMEHEVKLEPEETTGSESENLSSKSQTYKKSRGVYCGSNNDPMEALSHLPEETKNSVLEYVELLEAEAKKPKPPLPMQPYRAVDNNQLECVYCEKLSSSVAVAIKHYRFRHGERYNRCLACNATFRRHDAMLFHEVNCSAEDAHLLRMAREFCSRRKKNKVLYKIRKKEKQPCPKCGNFITRQNMAAHMSRHDPDRTRKRFFCEQCPVSFLSLRSLEAHYNMHAGIKPYLCRTCGTAFANKNCLLSHKWVHVEKRFTCYYCNRAYRKKNVLAKHIQYAHEGKDNSILCPKCGCTVRSVFWGSHWKKCNATQKDNSKKSHLKNDDSKKSNFNCIDCGKVFKQINGLNSHMKRIHGKEVFTRKKFLEMFAQVKDFSGLEFDLVKSSDIEIDPKKTE